MGGRAGRRGRGRAPSLCATLARACPPSSCGVRTWRARRPARTSSHRRAAGGPEGRGAPSGYGPRQEQKVRLGVTGQPVIRAGEGAAVPREEDHLPAVRPPEARAATVLGRRRLGCPRGRAAPGRQGAQGRTRHRWWPYPLPRWSHTARGGRAHSVFELRAVGSPARSGMPATPGRRRSGSITPRGVISGARCETSARARQRRRGGSGGPSAPGAALVPGRSESGGVRSGVTAAGGSSRWPGPRCAGRRDHSCDGSGVPTAALP